jgi:hypothetical protein
VKLKEIKLEGDKNDGGREARIRRWQYNNNLLLCCNCVFIGGAYPENL